MELKPWYPADYKLAVSNTLLEEEVDAFLTKPGASARFVYGALMLPTVLKYYIHMDQSIDITKNMTPATLTGYKLYRYTNSGPPVIAPSLEPSASVEGMLIFDLSEEQRNAIYEFEAGLMALISVEVEICQRNGQDLHSLRTIEPVGTFVWQSPEDGLTPLEAPAWDIGSFVTSQFYESIAQSQSVVYAESLSSSSSRDSLRDHSGASSPAQDRGNASVSSNRRWRTSLDQIAEEERGPHET
ncbi:hypothetical protein V8E54_014471 [Elaphomyces granulatus]|jgi:hypothetical protein